MPAVDRMTAFEPQPQQRTHCVHCGAARPTHDYATGACPSAYRPDTLADALRELTAARAVADPSRIFTARGEVQRLTGHRLGDCQRYVQHPSAVGVGDIVTARNGLVLPVGPVTVRGVSPAMRGGRRVGWRIRVERYATLVTGNDDTLTVLRGPRCAGCQALQD